MARTANTQAQIAKLKKQLDALLKKENAIKSKTHEKTLAQIVKLAKDNAITAKDIEAAMGSTKTKKATKAKAVGARKSALKGAKVAPKYRNPSNHEQTWSAAGGTPFTAAATANLATSGAALCRLTASCVQSGAWQGTGGIETGTPTGGMPAAGGINTAMLQVNGVYVKPGLNYSTPVTGFSATLAATDGQVILNPSGTLATGTVTMPASPSDGQPIGIVTTQQITSFSVVANTGQTIAGAPSAATISPGYRLTCVYSSAASKWVCGR